jgi:hypothetical protein
MAAGFASGLAVGLILGLAMPADGSPFSLPFYAAGAVLLIVSVWVTEPKRSAKWALEALLMLLFIFFSALLGAMAGSVIRWIWLHPDVGPVHYSLGQGLVTAQHASISVESLQLLGPCGPAGFYARSHPAASAIARDGPDRTSQSQFWSSSILA